MEVINTSNKIDKLNALLPPISWRKLSWIEALNWINEEAYQNGVFSMKRYKSYTWKNNNKQLYCIVHQPSNEIVAQSYIRSDIIKSWRTLLIAYNLLSSRIHDKSIVFREIGDFVTLITSKNNRKNKTLKLNNSNLVNNLSPETTTLGEFQLLQAKVGRFQTVWYCTNRKGVDHSTLLNTYSNEIDTTLHYVRCQVNVPQYHKIGDIGDNFTWISSWLFNSVSTSLEITYFSELKCEGFYSLMQNCISSLDVNDRTALLYIHGFNNSFDDAILRAAQLAADSSFPGVMASFSWPSQDSLFAYDEDEKFVNESVRALVTFITQLQQIGGVDTLHILAHSMGNRCLIRALEILKKNKENCKLGQLIFAAADVSVNDFPLIKEFPKSLRRTIYTNSEDKALLLSSILNDDLRVGENFIEKRADSIHVIPELYQDLELMHTYFGDSRPVVADWTQLIYYNTPPDKRVLVKKVVHNSIFWELNL